MPGVLNTILIEGSFEELADEFANYLDQLKKSQGDESSKIQSDVAALQGQGKQDDVLKKLVSAADILNSAPEKGLHRPSHMFDTQITRLQNSFRHIRIYYI